MSLTGRNSAALDRLSEEQRQEGGALAHADQRAAWIHAAGLNCTSATVVTLEREGLKTRDERRFIACSEDFLHDYEGFISYLLCVINEFIIHNNIPKRGQIQRSVL